MIDDLRSRMLAAMKPIESAASISDNAKPRLHGYSVDTAGEKAVTPDPDCNRDFINKINDVTVLPGFSANTDSQPDKGCLGGGPEVGCQVEIVEVPHAQRYRKMFAFLQLQPPAHIPVERWQRCVEDGSRFLAVWGEQAEALRWDSRDLFGLHTPPERPHPSYSRLSRYDETGLIWFLQGRPVVALTEATAAIHNPTTGNVTT